MEAKALGWAGLQNVPVNSFKGYFGHTLGAAGLIETILTLHSMQDNRLIKSIGYTEHGVSVPLNIITENQGREINCALKTASGFGGCNAGIILRNYEL
jgi:3-oxoacyl-[acyl-carrier-protein] synthase-1